MILGETGNGSGGVYHHFLSRNDGKRLSLEGMQHPTP